MPSSGTSSQLSAIPLLRRFAIGNEFRDGNLKGGSYVVQPLE